MKVLSLGGVCLYSHPPLSGRSSGHGLVNPVSSLRAGEEELKVGDSNLASEPKVDPGTQVQLQAPLICLFCLLTGSLNLIQGWALTILPSPWLKTRTNLVTPSPLATVSFPYLLGNC